MQERETAAGKIALHQNCDFFLLLRLIKGEEEERGEDRDAKRNKQLEHASQRYSAEFKEEITETAGKPSMRTRIQSSQQSCQLQDETRALRRIKVIPV